MKTDRYEPAYPCKCWGLWTLTDPSTTSYEICPGCFWEDDPAQNEDPSFADPAGQQHPGS